MSKTSKHASQISRGDTVMNAAFPDVITITHVRVLDGYRVRMTFSNREIRELDLKSYLNGPVFEVLARDIVQFRRVFVDPETETLTWHNGADMDPQTLYEDSVPVGPQTMRRTREQIPKKTAENGTRVNTRKRSPVPRKSHSLNHTRATKTNSNFRKQS